LTMPPIKHPTNRAHRISALPSVLNLRLLLARKKYAATILHFDQSIFGQKLKCCVDPLKSLRIADIRRKRKE